MRGDSGPGGASPTAAPAPRLGHRGPASVSAGPGEPAALGGLDGRRVVAPRALGCRTRWKTRGAPGSREPRAPPPASLRFLPDPGWLSSIGSPGLRNLVQRGPPHTPVASPASLSVAFVVAEACVAMGRQENVRSSRRVSGCGRNARCSQRSSPPGTEYLLPASPPPPPPPPSARAGTNRGAGSLPRRAGRAAQAWTHRSSLHPPRTPTLGVPTSAPPRLAPRPVQTSAREPSASLPVGGATVNAACPPAM